MNKQKPTYVASPIVPDWDTLQAILTPAIEGRRLTNGGPIASALEGRLAEILRTPHVSLVSNGTVAIELAAKALKFRNKVITTPFSFVATASALAWIGIEPIFVDVDEIHLTLDPGEVERHISDDVSGIVGVHVYGCPCDVHAFDAISSRFELPVLYDGAHIFDTTLNGAPLTSFGDACTLSFHATKQFNTGEGGAIVTKHSAIKAEVDLLRNFGIIAEDEISSVGINGKMSEVSAAFGLANLEKLFDEKAHRQALKDCYIAAFEQTRGVEVVPVRPGTLGATHYLAVRFPSSQGVSRRDSVYLELREHGIFARKYFNPLLSDVDAFKRLMSSPPNPLPNAERAAKEVLVLPLHGRVPLSKVDEIVSVIAQAA